MNNGEPRWPPTSLVARLAAGPQAALLGAGTTARYRPGEVLLSQGDSDERAAFAVLILAGYVRVVVYADTGEKALLAIRGGGELVGEMAPLDGQPRSATVIAATKVTGRRISKAQLRDLIHRHKEIGRMITVITNERLRWANQRRVDFVSLDAPERIARVLVEIAEPYGELCPEGLRLMLTQHDIASLAGQRLASAERALRRLETDGLIRRGYRQLTVTDLTRMRMVAKITTENPY